MKKKLSTCYKILVACFLLGAVAHFIWSEFVPCPTAPQLAKVHDMDLTELTPTLALAQFHDAWASTIAPAIPPPFVLACDTNSLTEQATFSASDITPEEFLEAYCELVGLCRTSYRNAIVFYPIPVYNAAVIAEEIPVSRSVAECLGISGVSRRKVEERLRALGLNLPCSGCGASYDNFTGILRFWHVDNEIAKVRFVVDQLSKGVSLNDVAIDPNVHMAPASYVYRNGTWIAWEKDHNAGQSGDQ